jgi:hypothetical protein
VGEYCSSGAFSGVTPSNILVDDYECAYWARTVAHRAGEPFRCEYEEVHGPSRSAAAITRRSRRQFELALPESFSCPNSICYLFVSIHETMIGDFELTRLCQDQRFLACRAPTRSCAGTALTSPICRTAARTGPPMIWKIPLNGISLVPFLPARCSRLISFAATRACFRGTGGGSQCHHCR